MHKQLSNVWSCPVTSTHCTPAGKTSDFLKLGERYTGMA